MSHNIVQQICTSIFEEPVGLLTIYSEDGAAWTTERLVPIFMVSDSRGQVINND